MINRDIGIHRGHMGMYRDYIGVHTGHSIMESHTEKKMETVCKYSGSYDIEGFGFGGLGEFLGRRGWFTMAD